MQNINIFFLNKEILIYFNVFVCFFHSPKYILIFRAYKSNQQLKQKGKKNIIFQYVMLNAN
jgi:hypothetical protein